MVSPIEYSAIKSGIISITKYLAKYCKGENIRVNCVSPGGILDNQPEVFLEKYNATCSSKGMLDAQDISGTFIYLLSDASKYLNGQTIVVDDGWSL
jgi:NAD(P)-dependent dehydrogenase (short-subunit alcohol dehydrogenase family)